MATCVESPPARLSRPPDADTEAALRRARAAFAAALPPELPPLPPLPSPAREDIPGVPGAFLVRNAFTPEEAARLGAAVQDAHGGRAPR
ncbi:unnamed protein product, partial [Effrenium voratum]